MHGQFTVCASALTLALATVATGDTYVGPGAVIPDGVIDGPPGVVTTDIVVPGGFIVGDLSVSLVGLTHSWIGDLVVTLTHLPTGATQTVMHRVGLPGQTQFGDSSNLNGTYSFNDLFGGDLWATAASGGTNWVVPSGGYFPSAAGSPAAVSLLSTFGGKPALGTWRLTVSDYAGGDFGAFTSWTLTLAEGSAVCPGLGSCFVAHFTPGCDDTECCEVVCAADPFCCAIKWDQLCANEAEAICGELPVCPGTGSCFEVHSTAGCDDAECCLSVCGFDPFCCESTWDAICVVEALELCGGCGIALSGCCFEPHGTPGCEQSSCCEAVCATDPFCCEVSWDLICVEAALSACCPADLNGDGVIDGQDLGVVLSVWGLPTELGDLDCSGEVDGEDLGMMLGGWGRCGG